MTKNDTKSVYQYEISPKILVAGKKTAVTIKPLLKAPFETGVSYTVIVTGMMQHDTHEYKLMPNGGNIILDHYFGYEQEYSVKIYAGDVEPTPKRLVSVIYLYCLDEDLHKLRPFKGDFHMHSQQSDGYESPAGVCAQARKHGLDFWALTDHRKYLPSAVAKDAFKGIALGAKIYNGEEVHFHEQGHIIAFGGSEGIGEKYASPDYAHQYEAELAETYERLKSDFSKLPDTMAPEEYVRWTHAVEKVKETGAMAVFVHPFWVQGTNSYHVGYKSAKFLMREGGFHAFELLNGEYSDTNSLQIAFWQEERGGGRYMPIVSGTDAHSLVEDDFFGKFFTVIFAQDMQLESIKQAVKDERSIVVSAMAKGTPPAHHGLEPLAYGHFRYAAFALYLVREVFPLHDEICFEEGRLMARHVAGDNDAADRLSAHSVAVERLYDRLWGAKTGE